MEDILKENFQSVKGLTPVASNYHIFCPIFLLQNRLLFSSKVWQGNFAFVLPNRFAVYMYIHLPQIIMTHIHNPKKCHHAPFPFQKKERNPTKPPKTISKYYENKLLKRNRRIKTILLKRLNQIFIKTSSCK